MTEDSSAYPELAALVDACFHQDMDLFGDTNEDVFRYWVQGGSAAARAQMAAEVDRFIGAYPDAPLTSFNTLFQPEMPLADDDAGLIETLTMLRKIAIGTSP
ncbi:MAG: contact-dependent growth inhibition system immunity protein [Paracoccus sp. (in: a-proteobacteria)]|nr:contact-dependent growth inhibition system immunity protein [Paracoccus sp. (in: a-proteobacteria)]